VSNATDESCLPQKEKDKDKDKVDIHPSSQNPDTQKEQKEV
jgi:hypothetical protein